MVPFALLSPRTGYDSRSRRRAAFLPALCVACLIVSASVTSSLGQISAVPPEFIEATKAMQEGRLQEAAAGFAAAAKKQPSFAGAYFNLGLADEELGKYEEAVLSLRQALKLKPGMHGASLFLGIAQFRLNHVDEAAVAILKETANFPKDANAWMWLGIVRLGQNRPEDAAEALDKAAKLNPDDQNVLYHRGRAHLLVSKNSYAKMFKLNEDSWLVHRVLAQANAEADRHVDAIAEYEAAIKLAPNQPGLHEELGTEYRAVNKISEAEQAFQKELELDPHNILATYKLGAIEVEKGDGAKGKELIEAAKKEKPDLVHLDYNLGRADMLLNEDSDAVSHFERSVKNDPDPEVIEQAWFQLGTAYRRLHRMEEARNAMTTYQQLKDQEAAKSQKALENYRAQHTGAADVPAPQSPR